MLNVILLTTCHEYPFKKTDLINEGQCQSKKKRVLRDPIAIVLIYAGFFSQNFSFPVTCATTLK